MAVDDAFKLREGLVLDYVEFKSVCVGTALAGEVVPGGMIDAELVPFNGVDCVWLSGSVVDDGIGGVIAEP